MLKRLHKYFGDAQVGRKRWVGGKEYTKEGEDWGGRAYLDF